MLCQSAGDQDDPNRDRLAANRAVLEAAVDARGRRLDVVELELLPYLHWAGRRVALPYLNFYVANDGVVVPLARVDADEHALERVAELFPGRRVVGVPATNLGRRGGGPHCITEQVPRKCRRAALAALREVIGGYLLSREVALRVPSARVGLTSLFGMGRGVSPPL